MPTSRVTAPHYVWGDACDGWRLVDGAGMTVIHERMPPTTAERRHHHRAARQFFFVLAGRATFDLDGVFHALAPHEGIEVPPGTPHHIRNDGDRDLEFLVVSQPSTTGDRVEA